MTSERCDGRMNNTSSRESSSAKVTTMGSGSMKKPMVPGISRNGTNAATVVTTVVTTGQATS